MATQVKRGPKPGAGRFTPAPYELVEPKELLAWGESVARGRGAHYLEALQALVGAPTGRTLRFEGEPKRIIPQVRKYAKRLQLEVEFAEKDTFLFVREKATPLYAELLKAILKTPRTTAELHDAIKDMPGYGQVTAAEVKLALDQMNNRGKAHKRDIKWFPGPAANGGTR